MCLQKSVFTVGSTFTSWMSVGLFCFLSCFILQAIHHLFLAHMLKSTALSNYVLKTHICHNWVCSTETNIWMSIPFLLKKKCYFTECRLSRSNGQAHNLKIWMVPSVFSPGFFLRVSQIRKFGITKIYACRALTKSRSYRDISFNTLSIFRACVIGLCIP